MRLPENEIRHDATRVEYIRGLVENNGGLKAHEAFAVAGHLEGIANKHRVTDINVSPEDYIGFGSVALEACDKLIAHFIKQIPR